MATLTGGAVGTLQQPSPRAERMPFGARGSTFVARVTRVSDGDTIDVTTSANGIVRLRLEGIDAPEAGQPFGQLARNFTRQLAFNQLVTVRVLDRDQYDRLVVRVTSQGKDVSVELLKAGLAWHYTQYSSDATLAAAEQDARKARRGLWVDPNAVPPWVARRPTQPRGPPAQATPARRPIARQHQQPHVPSRFLPERTVSQLHGRIRQRERRAGSGLSSGRRLFLTCEVEQLTR